MFMSSWNRLLGAIYRLRTRYGPRLRVWSRYALPFGVLLAVSPALAQTNEIRLAWDQSTGANGYRVKWGTATRTYTGDLDVGNPCAFDAAYNAVVCRHTLTGLPVAANSFVAITAYNAAGESGFSREIQGWPRPEITTSSSNCAPGDPDGATCDCLRRTEHDSEL
jgi:hypothetical protein